MNNTIKQLDLTDISRTLHLTTAEYTFFSSAHEILYRLDYRLGHKSQ